MLIVALQQLVCSIASNTVSRYQQPQICLSFMWWPEHIRARLLLKGGSTPLRAWGKAKQHFVSLIGLELHANLASFTFRPRRIFLM